MDTTPKLAPNAFYAQLQQRNDYAKRWLMKQYVDQYFTSIKHFEEVRKQKMISYFVEVFSDKLQKAGFGAVKKPSEVLHKMITKPLSKKHIPQKGTQHFKPNKVLILVKKTLPETQNLSL